ncbi:hypothetical protein B4134_1817 [Bacillus safensis]|nr:SMI1/KNR4 family protein [Bacillus safensis]KIL21056.1 hypothetical protein B4134_1817 [Bacillus safensis]
MKPFWEIDEEGYYTLKKINEAEISKAEKKLGVTLPDTYKKLILEQNGGYIFHKLKQNFYLSRTILSCPF